MDFFSHIIYPFTAKCKTEKAYCQINSYFSSFNNNLVEKLNSMQEFVKVKS